MEDWGDEGTPTEFATLECWRSFLFQLVRPPPLLAYPTLLVRALGLAHYWQTLLDDGKYRSFADIAAAEGLDKAQVCRICGLVYFAPDITETILSGQEAGLTLERLMR